MDFKEQSYSVLVVSASEKFNTSIKAFLSEYRYFPVCFETGISGAKRKVSERDFDFLIINSPLPDSDGIRFSIDVSCTKNSVVLLMVKNELYSAIYEKVYPYGVYILPKVTSKQTILQGLDWLTSTRERLKKNEIKAMSIEDKMKEIRIVNRAKLLLISELKMTEADAHRFIEKSAMDSSKPKIEVAEKIIQSYT